MSYTASRRRPYAQRSTSGQPTPKALAYLADLVKKSGQTQEEWRESKGLYEHSPWGRRLRSEAVTSASVSRWISELKSAT